MMLAKQEVWLSWSDYLVFSVFMAVSVGVGVFFALRGRRQRSTSEYLTGDRRMGALSIAISIAVSFTSSLTTLGFPSEAFVNGYMIIFIFAGGPLTFLVSCCLFAKLLHPLGFTSPNEYLRRRYRSQVVSVIGYVFSTLTTCLYMGLVMYGPAVALSEATGGRLSIPMAFLLGNIIGMVYTTIGGLKAVVWTDVIQAGFMVAAVLITCIYAIVQSGGVTAVVNYSWEYSRIHPLETSLDFGIRHTVVGVLVNGISIWSSAAILPANVQRLVSLPKLNAAYLSYMLAAPMLLFFGVSAVITGLAIFGFYAHVGCDIWRAGWLSSDIAIVPYFVTTQMAFYGFPGLLMAAIYASSLSTLSSGLGGLGATVWLDVLKPYCCTKLTDRKAAVLVKAMVAAFGVLSTVLGFVAMKSGKLFIQTYYSLEGAIEGPYSTLFFLGGMVPFVNKFGAVAGAMAGVACGLTLNVLSFTSTSSTQQLPTVLTNCTSLNDTLSFNVDLNMTSTTVTTGGIGISYVWFKTISSLTSVVVALLVSLITCRLSPKVESKYVWAMCRRGTVDEEDEVEEEEAEHFM